MSGTDLKKKREILFSKFPPGQIPEAADDLQRMEDLEVQTKYEERSLGVSYDCSSTPCANSTSIWSTRATTSTTPCSRSSPAP